MSRGIPFPPGNKFGRGRPRGSRNKSTLALKALLAEYGEPLVRKCVAMALRENSGAMRACMDRLMPVRREPPVQFKLPDVRTAPGLDDALHALLQAAAHGRLTPTETKLIAEVLEGKRRAIETVELEARIQALESPEAPPSGADG